MDIELIDFEEWGKRKSEKTPFLPYITSEEGNIMLETTVIHKYLAEVGGKFVVDEATAKLLETANGAPLQLADPLYNLPEVIENFVVCVCVCVAIRCQVACVARASKASAA